MTPLEKITADLKARLPHDLVDALLKHYKEIKENFYLNRHEPSELNGGKFAEIGIRILQHETGSAITPIGQQIGNVAVTLKSFDQVATSRAIDSFRIHIPRTLIVMCDVRNKRGVAHPNVEVNPNYSDASLLVSCADWVMAELFRIYYNCPLDEAQAIVNSLMQRRLLLVHEVDDVKRVLLPDMSPRDKVLMLLYTEHPRKVSEADLLVWAEVGTNKKNWRDRYFLPLHKEKKVEYRKEEWFLLLPPGVSYVEANYQKWLAELNK